MNWEGTYKPLSALLVTSVFPPEAAVGGHRSVGLCRYLARQRWKVTVLTMTPPADAGVDRGLLHVVPKEIKVVRVACPDIVGTASGVFQRVVFWRPRKGRHASSATPPVPTEAPPLGSGGLEHIVDWLSWWLQLPDARTGWVVPAVRAGLREARRYRPDIIFSTAPVWTAHLVGLILSYWLRVPWVADFRDPWCDSAFREIPYASHRRVNGLLEGLTISHATGITCATDGIRRQLAARYPAKASAMRTVLNGFDPEALDGVPPVRLDGSRCVCLHAGSFYGPRSPAPLFQALGKLRRTTPDVAARLQVALVGNPTYGHQTVDRLAADYGLDEVVRVMPHVSHGQAIGLLKGADVALLFGQGGDAAFRPLTAKVYEYIGVGKPILAIGAGDEALEVMRRGGCKVWAVSEDDPQGLAAALEDILAHHARGHLRSGENATARLAFTRSRMAEELASTMDLAMAKWASCKQGPGRCR